MRLLDSFLFLIAGIIIGGLLYAFLLGGPREKRDPMPDVKQQILLERIKQVAKLVTVEGQFSNIHEYKDFYWADISILSKKALLRVKAKVSVGYDLQKMTWEVDSLNKIIRVRNLPEPEIISIDHDVEYYDMHEGMFNSFKEAELTEINVVIKKKLRQEAEKGPLMEKAKQEGIQNLEIIKLLVEQAGWTFEIINGATETMQDSLKNINIPSTKIRMDSLIH